jgi:hypothetical protein
MFIFPILHSTWVRPERIPVVYVGVRTSGRCSQGDKAEGRGAGGMGARAKRMSKLLRVVRLRLPSHSPLTRSLTASGCEIRMNATPARPSIHCAQAQAHAESRLHPSLAGAERLALEPCACVSLATPWHGQLLCSLSPLAPPAVPSPVLSVLAFPGRGKARLLLPRLCRSNARSLLRSRSFIHSVLVKILLQSLSLSLSFFLPRRSEQC